MSRFAVLPVALLMLLAIAAPVNAAQPVHTTTTSTYTLADAIFDYENFGIYDGDCGDFVLLVDFDVVRSVTTWPDREIRHVRYEGHFYNASDTSKSIVRNGDFALTFRFDATGGLLEPDLDRAVRVRRGRGTPAADDRRAIDDGLRVRPTDFEDHAARFDGDARVRLRRPSLRPPAALLVRGGGTHSVRTSSPASAGVTDLIDTGNTVFAHEGG